MPIKILSGAPGALGALAFSRTRGSSTLFCAPWMLGPMLGAPSPFVLNAAGDAQLHFDVPASVAGQTFFAQAAALDSLGAPCFVQSSNGLVLRF